MIEKYPAILIQFAVYLLLQIVFFKDIALFGKAICLVYIVPLLLLPPDTKPWQLMLFAFALGFATDVFYNTGGLHAASCVFLAFLRPYILNLIVPSGGYDTSAQLSHALMGTSWFLIYGSITVSLHHLGLFLFEAFTLTHIIQTLLTALFSSLFTLTTIVVLQVLFHRS
jgi:rod shape-determining protein MreD